MLNPLMGESEKMMSNIPVVPCDFSFDGVLPKEMDWRALNMTSPVKNQGKCGSCYIFSAISALESQYLINTYNRPEFSEQALLNCLDSGCNGGWMSWVWEYMLDNGATFDGNCPYKGKVDIKAYGLVSPVNLSFDL